MTNKVIDMSAVREVMERLARQEESILQSKKYILELMSSIQGRIIAGETTGDRFQDIVIRCHGLPDEVLEANYRELEGKLKGRQGEFVVIEFSKDIPFKFTMTGSESRRHTFFRIGLLAGDSLVFETLNEGSPFKECTLPVPQYLAGNTDTLYVWKNQTSRAPDKQNIFAGGSLYHEQPPELRAVVAGFKQLEFIVGNEAVQEWLKKHSAEKFFKVAADALSMLSMEPTEP
jgi:hypothetical protein